MLSGSETVPVPPRYARVDPWVISSDAEAEIAFLETAFDAQETLGSRMLGPDGRIGHVEVELGESVIMLFDAQPEWRPTPAHLRVYVADTQETFDRAVAAGARPVTHPTELAFGERVARVRDPQVHLWWIHHRSRMLRLPSWADASPTHRRNKHWPTSSSLGEGAGASTVRTYQVIHRFGTDPRGYQRPANRFRARSSGKSLLLDVSR
jgi:PhnB protein